jgi:hypothetical protein
MYSGTYIVSSNVSMLACTYSYIGIHFQFHLFAVDLQRVITELELMRSSSDYVATVGTGSTTQNA